ncbi:MAG: type IV pilus assembly protein PilM [Actinobacteria bacterium]|nr:type IV pilus assembly protein PilM [Actinomycetota bacterium]
MAVAVGLDIGSGAVRAAVVDIAKSAPVLRRFAEMPLPPGAVVSGEIIDDGAVTEAVSALWRRNKLPKKRVVIGLANQRVIVRQVDVPHLEEAEMVEALPFQVQDAIPIPVEEAVLDYVPLEEFNTPDGDLMMSVLVIAAQREMADGLMAVAKSAGLSVMSIDLTAFGLVRAAFGADLLLGGDGPQGLLDIGASMSQIAVVRGGITRFVRILPVGGSQFTDDLKASLSVSFEDAEELKRVVGVAPEGMPEGDGDQEAARRTLTRTADGLIEEIRGSINYYLTQAGEHNLDRLVVSGNGARLPHLANRVARSLSTRVEPVRVLEHIGVGRIGMTESQLLDLQPVLPASVGLAMWGKYVVGPSNRFAHVA